MSLLAFIAGLAAGFIVGLTTPLAYADVRSLFRGTRALRDDGTADRSE